MCEQFTGRPRSLIVEGHPEVLLGDVPSHSALVASTAHSTEVSAQDHADRSDQDDPDDGQPGDHDRADSRAAFGEGWQDDLVGDAAEGDRGDDEADGEGGRARHRDAKNQRLTLQQ